jgi:hypothetical protein
MTFFESTLEKGFYDILFYNDIPSVFSRVPYHVGVLLGFLPMGLCWEMRSLNAALPC